MQMVTLERTPPRDLGEIRHQVDARFGLRVYWVSGFVLVAAGVIVAVSSLFPPYETGLIFFKIVAGLLLFAGCGALLIRKAGRAYSSRLRILREGVLVDGRVVAHERAFVFWKSTRDYVVVVEFAYDGPTHRARVRSPSSALHKELLPGAGLTGLVDPESKASLFLESMGYSLSSQ